MFLLLVIAVFAGGCAQSASTCWTNLEITFMIDHKKCVGEDVHNNVVKPLLTRFVRKLRATEVEDVRVSLITYGADVEVINPSSQSETDLLAAVTNLRFQPGKLNLESALRQCQTREDCFPETQEDAQRVIIALTNGKADDPDTLKLQVQDYQARGFRLLSHHVDDLSDYRALKRALGANKEEKCGRNFAGEAVAKIVRTKCAEASPVNVNVMFVMQASTALNKTQKMRGVEFANGVIDLMDADTNFAGLAYNHKVQSLFPWTDDEDIASSSLDDVIDITGGATFTGRAMNQALDKFSSVDDNAGKVMIVVTGGAASGPDRVQDAIQRAANEGVHVLVVAVGPNSEEDPSSKHYQSFWHIAGDDQSKIFRFGEEAMLVGKIDDLLNGQAAK